MAPQVAVTDPEPERNATAMPVESTCTAMVSSVAQTIRQLAMLLPPTSYVLACSCVR
jgi:hypothetical protein